jgi:hypothetical protein
MVSNPFIPQYLVSREQELQQVSQNLAADSDFMIVGAPGIGRRTLIRAAAQQVGAKVLEIDCLRTTSAERFLQLLATKITEVFNSATELALIQRWSANQPFVLETTQAERPRLIWHFTSATAWDLLQILIGLPQQMAEWLECRVVISFLNFAHIRSWDRTGQWEAYLKQEIQRQSRVSYVLVGTVVEPWVQSSQLPVIFLAPLEPEDLQAWIVPTMATEGLRFDSDSQALNLFLNYVQGHLGDAIALARRIWLDYRAFNQPFEPVEANCRAMADIGLIQAHHVHRSALALVEDLSVTFESLILLLPPSQVRVLESLALDPTDKPHARDYIRKHQLSRGGGLQGALTSLEQKGLVYGAKYNYRVALPFLALWLTYRLQ